MICQTCTSQVSSTHIHQKTKYTHAYSTPKYSTTTQLTIPDDTSDLLDGTGTICPQEILGNLIYYGLAVDNTMIVALGTLEASNNT